MRLTEKMPKERHGNVSSEEKEMRIVEETLIEVVEKCVIPPEIGNWYCESMRCLKPQ